jgi:CDGSH-type Zn-finger protein
MTERNNDIQRTKAYKIKVTKNGPYLATGGIPMSEQRIGVDSDGQSHGWKEGRIYPAQENCTLCRCGHSERKPFCDGVHARTNFDGTENATHEPYLDQANEIDGPSLKLTDAEDFCASARFCDRGEGAWALTTQSGDPDSRQKAIEEICDCPSGRLVAWDKKGKMIEPEFSPSIGLVEDTQAKKMGPIWIRGGIQVESADGKTYEIRNRVTLCRCGKSSNKPFCDGAHLE